MNKEQVLRIELWDLDLLADDKIQTITISKPSLVEFIFSFSETGEFNPELQIRICDNQDKEIHRTPINKSLNSLKIDKVTGFMEKTTVDFGTIKL
jgi:hypothetical protein